MNNIIESFVASRKWAKITGTLFIVLFALQFVSFLLGPIAGGAQKESIGVLIGTFIFTILFAALFYLLPGLYLRRYAKHVTQAENDSTNPSADLENACDTQGRFFRYLGIMSLVIVILSFLAIFAVAIPAYHSYLERAQIAAEE